MVRQSEWSRNVYVTNDNKIIFHHTRRHLYTACIQQIHGLLWRMCARGYRKVSRMMAAKEWTVTVTGHGVYIYRVRSHSASLRLTALSWRQTLRRTGSTNVLPLQPTDHMLIPPPIFQLYAQKSQLNFIFIFVKLIKIICLLLHSMI